MKKSDYYLPRSDAGKLALMERMVVRLIVYLALLEISAEEYAAFKADTLAWRYATTLAAEARIRARLMTRFRSMLRDGHASGSNAFPLPPPSEAAAPAAVSFGVIPRTILFVARIKSARNYTEAIGQDLGIIGVTRSVDPLSVQPTLNSHMKDRQPLLGWSKGAAEALEIWVARTPQDEFALLDVCCATHYLDHAPLPVQPASWRYKAIYRVRDERVGQWSAELTVLVSP